MATVFDSFEQFYPKDRNAWRNWLKKNRNKFPGIWLVYYKAGTSKPRLPYDDMVEEALCFGWIESLPRKLDDERSMLIFTPRVKNLGGEFGDREGGRAGSESQRRLVSSLHECGRGRSVDQRDGQDRERGDSAPRQCGLQFPTGRVQPR